MSATVSEKDNGPGRRMDALLPSGIVAYFLIYYLAFDGDGHNIMPLLVVITTYSAWTLGSRAALALTAALIAAHALILHFFGKIGLIALFSAHPILSFGVAAQILLIFIAHYFKTIHEQLETTRAELEKARTRAEEADRAKGAFMANLSHELRTPLCSIVGYAELLNTDAEITEKQRKRVTPIMTNVHHIMDLINKVLDFSKIENDRIDLEETEFDMASLVADVCSANRHLAARKGLSFNEKLSGAFARMLIGDPLRIRQILINLAGNAVKFTESGAVTVECREQEIDRGRVRVFFSISDTGIGIAPDIMANLFRPYSQGDASTERLHGGTGLGLAIANRLVVMMSQSPIAVKSETGKGSAFSFALTLKKGRPTPQRQPGESHSAHVPEHAHGSERKKLRVLVAEDNLFNLKLIRAILESRSHEVTEAKDGNAALEAALNDEFDLLLLDIQLPGATGVEIARKVRAAGKSVPMISISADTGATTAEECAAAGICVHIPKPFSPEDIFQAIEKTLS